jgi:hypothetical protein
MCGYVIDGGGWSPKPKSGEEEKKMSTYDDDEREKLSWSEIDKRKDRSKHVSGDKASYKKSKRSEWALKQYRKEAERLLMGKKGSDAYKKARNAIHDRHGTPKFNAAVKSFVREYGLPDDWDTLFLLLDYKDTFTVEEVLSRLMDSYRERSLTEMQGFRAKLEIMETTIKDEKLKGVVETILHAL